MPILSASKPPVIADEEPSESQLDMFIRANKKDSRKRVSFGDDARDGDEVRQTSDVQHEHADFPATEELDHETQESMDSEF